MKPNHTNAGRVIRRYYKDIPIKDFDKWRNTLVSKAKGWGLYALYNHNKLVYVGLATKSIRGRIGHHLDPDPLHHRKGKKKFTRFSVFLVTGASSFAKKQRIRDLEALLLNIINPLPKYNNAKTKFVGASKLQCPRGKS